MAKPLTYSEEHIEQRSMRPYFIIWGGQSVSLFGSQIVQFALIWWLTRTSGSATVLALATMLSILPRLFISPFAGVLVDRLNRRRVMILADAFIALLVLVLIALSLVGVIRIWHVYLILFLRAIGEIFHRPAYIASTSLMVPKKHLSRISGLNHSVSGALEILTPVLGALLVEAVPLPAVLAIDVVTAAFAITALLLVAVPQPDTSAPLPGVQSRASRLLADMKSGFMFLVSWRGIFQMVLVYAFVHLFFTPAVSIMPILVTDYFQGGALQLGWMQSATGVGLIAGGLLLSAWGGHRRRIVTSMLGLTLLGLCFVAIGLTPPGAFPAALAAMFFVGFSITFVTALRMAIWQAVIPPGFQGRVFSFMGAMMALLDIIGLAAVGPMTDRFGPQLSYLLCGLATACLGMATFFIPAIMNVEDQRFSTAPAATDGT